MSWPGLTRPSSHDLNLVFFWMAASKGGHDDGIGGNIRVIKKVQRVGKAAYGGKFASAPAANGVNLPGRLYEGAVRLAPPNRVNPSLTQ